MSLLTAFRAPGTGHRQADPLARLAADNLRLREALQLEREENGRLYADLHQTASVLGEIVVIAGEERIANHKAIQTERDAHADTRRLLDIATRSNLCNLNAETVQTDVTMLRASHAAQADVVPAEYRPEPERRPYPRFPTTAIRVVPLWDSPQAAHAARVPGLAELAGAR